MGRCNRCAAFTCLFGSLCLYGGVVRVRWILEAFSRFPSWLPPSGNTSFNATPMDVPGDTHVLYMWEETEDFGCDEAFLNVSIMFTCEACSSADEQHYPREVNKMNNCSDDDPFGVRVASFSVYTDGVADVPGFYTVTSAVPLWETTTSVWGVSGIVMCILVVGGSCICFCVGGSCCFVGCCAFVVWPELVESWPPEDVEMQTRAFREGPATAPMMPGQSFAASSSLSGEEPLDQA